jgi:hypothetical protein
LLESLGNAGNLLGVAVDVVRRAREAKKPDLERVTGYMDRDAKRLRDRVERRLRDFDAEVDTQLLAALLVRAAALPEAARIAALAPLIADASGTTSSASRSPRACAGGSPARAWPTRSPIGRPR